jgi:hypothetical protein
LTAIPALELLVRLVIGPVAAGTLRVEHDPHIDTGIFLAMTAAIKLGSVNVNCLIKSDFCAELMNSRTGSRPSSGSTIRRGRAEA